MPFNISNFTSQLNSGRNAKPSLFECLMTRPRGNVNVERDLTFRIEKAVVPGRQALTLESVTYGPPTNIAYGSGNPNELGLTIILSEDYREKLYFEEWLDTVIGNYRTGESSANKYDVGYYSEYIGNLKIYTYSDTAKNNYTIECTEIYPVNIGDVQLDWNSGSEIAKLDVNFRYKQYIDKKETSNR